MDNVFANINTELTMAVVRALIFFIVGIILSRAANNVVTRWSTHKLDAHKQLLVARVASYLVLLMFFFMGLKALGFDLGVLIGAAGIISVAIGFASQTSASNIISGLFLVSERPFSIGDMVRVGSTIGEVISIDLLSVKLRTFDNLFVRIPNETLIKSEVTTLTRFPIRRIDLAIGVAYKESIKHVRKVMERVADANPICLDEPKPTFIFKGFGDSSLDMQFSVWVKRENFSELKNAIYEEIKEAFDAEGIEIPFPHQSIYAGSVTEPFPIRVVTEENEAGR
ncbi:MAG: small-conductance mechanosensitive channel [Cycloclasticus pugetii]|jgi:small-conductance mechanosensitive channel|uniref:Small-conductance mechanosensitive channel n=1 Tax=Cycloclasticus pugetii TaxID=34068 RepID=A0AB33Z4S2_9GAMM|nr:MULTISPECIES: mechanosensitive ion channel family protein [Cycloclasticus]AFT66679.1 Transporter, MscS family [Cycloclasticus sp. P1]ATI03686.1 mechanosensitive ion channel family protein [Cycloclasticus sp. PY97N]EPD14176.1 MscS family transporter [Cycloclasticus pugetii]PHR51906.1 MAG: mechanosensitive ion channel family protein [Cycloclasticus sp.]SHI98074.1 Mechanosensitive ion channel [Cycloclasticus pugetii]